LSQGRSVRLYLVDGSPTGLITAEIMNWTGHVLVGPRSRIGEVLKREEPSRTGVYFLVGDDPEQPARSRVYVGEGDNVADRMRSHVKDSAKDFWTRACIVTSKDMNLTKAHVRYLESRFVELTKVADRASLANGTEPGRKALPESDIADMEFFIAQVETVLPVVGLDFLRPKSTLTLATAASTISGRSPSAAIELVLASPRFGYAARAVELDGEVTVLNGSTATAREDFTTNIYGPLRAQLIGLGKLAPSQNPDFLEFKEDVPFASPSAAAAVIANRNTNGRTAWKLASTGQTLKDWQDAQVGQAATPDGPNTSPAHDG
jgi:hypothetical protein